MIDKNNSFSNVELNNIVIIIEDWKIAIEKTNKEIVELKKTLKGIGLSLGNASETFFEQATKEGITLKIKGKEIFFNQSYVNFLIRDNKTLETKAEIDILMINKDYLLLIETKYCLKDKYKEEHKEQIKKAAKMLKQYNSEAVKGKEILTAFAAMGVKQKVKENLTQNGYFVFTEKNHNLHIDPPT